MSGKKKRPRSKLKQTPEQHGGMPLKKNKRFPKKCSNFFTILIFTAYYIICEVKIEAD